jgi:hypothetical protein
VDQGLVRQVLGQGVAYGGGGDLAFQPGGDARGEVLGVGGGQEQAGVVAAQTGQDVDGGLEQVRRAV